ncbi:MAG TPA: helicase, partial [Clostridiales bacterium]|nr:helicase [Clostridiales bacterium]
SFIELENNEDLEFMNNITESLDIDYKELEKGTLKLPIYRSLYLDKLLENLKNVNVNKDEQYKKIIKDIDIDELNDDILVPKSLNANLRLYQKIGFKWLKSLDEYNLGGILADDMGLGKTVQLLALILDYKENNKDTKPTIVVTPSSLTLNWQSEISKFTSNLKVQVIHGNVEDREKQINEINNYDVIITSYDLLKRDIDLYKKKNIEFQYIIADEAQYIKNNNTKNSKAIKEINAKTRFALTGTPIENSLSELWSIFDFIMPGYLFSYRKFKQIYELPIIKENDVFITNRLKKLISPFILRRIKKDVLTELPDKTITVLNNEMSGEQLDVYMSYLAQAKQEVLVEIKNRGFEASQMKILALLMRLRQICCHPSLFIENYEGESSKLNQCMQITKDAIEGGHKILLFSGYTSMFNILEQELKKERIEYFKLTGQTKVPERIKLVDEFNQNDNIKVFLISLKAGGTGLNLTGADMVIHYDPWWNISAENQATDRTYRIGQKKNVQVYKLITKNSIEERIYELQQKKEKLIDNMLSTKETFVNKLSKEEIMELFK